MRGAHAGRRDDEVGVDADPVPDVHDAFLEGTDGGAAHVAHAGVGDQGEQPLARGPAQSLLLRNLLWRKESHRDAAERQ